MAKTFESWLRKGFEWFRNQELIVLVMMLVIVVGVWAFIGVADQVMEGDTREVDEWMIRVLRNPADPGDPRGPVWLEEAVRDITALGSTVVLMLVTLVVIGFVILQRQYHALWLLAGALAGGLILNVGLKELFDRPRPDLVPRLLHVSSASFPSGHSLLSAVVYLTLATLLTRLVQRRRLKIYILGTALFISFLVGFSRIYLGVHYPSDVLAGWTVGLVWSVLCWLVAYHLQRRGLVEKASEAPA